MFNIGDKVELVNHPLISNRSDGIIDGIMSIDSFYVRFGNTHDFALTLSIQYLKLLTSKIACQHDIKVYDSGWSTYNYCSKCNEKL